MEPATSREAVNGRKRCIGVVVRSAAGGRRRRRIRRPGFYGPGAATASADAIVTRELAGTTERSGARAVPRASSRGGRRADRRGGGGRRSRGAGGARVRAGSRGVRGRGAVLAAIDDGVGSCSMTSGLGLVSARLRSASASAALRMAGGRRSMRATTLGGAASARARIAGRRASSADGMSNTRRSPRSRRAAAREPKSMANRRATLSIGDRPGCSGDVLQPVVSAGMSSAQPASTATRWARGRNSSDGPREGRGICVIVAGTVAGASAGSCILADAVQTPRSDTSGSCRAARHAGSADASTPVANAMPATCSSHAVSMSHGTRSRL